ncbi:pyruvate dehydrogenase (acetyl-transferring) E1 component subunit alpha [Paludisphaera sp.]|uniref:pyruvate dehydrogenase (acetyl-transferring) E1 component subunit alpha n=1 Tax=Paludisphaera sp. TaxID=2017432 RepID=UPI00301BC210
MASVQTEAKPIVDQTKALDWLRQMLLIRRFEERAEMLYQKGNKIFGFFHQYSGQEPVAVGSIGVLREDDWVITAYRDHGHALALGMSARSGMAELLGKVTGCSKGKGGSMHFFDAEKGMMGGHAIVGSHIPLAAGFAFASKYRGEDRVALCYLGDGAINQGGVHEALNMAALWKLPVIYIVENNLYAMGTSLVRSSSSQDLTTRCAVPYGIPGHQINGNDIELMARTTLECVEHARAGEGPSFIEARTYRYKGHSISDPGKYRMRDELDTYIKNDPIVIYENILKDRGWIDDETIEAMREEVKAEIEDSIEFAERSEDPPVAAVYEDITVAPFIPQE